MSNLLFLFLGKNFQVSMSMNNVSFIYLILYSIFWQLWSYFVRGQGETQGGWTHILLLVQYSTLLFACSPHLLVGVNVPDARKSNQSKRPARRRCSIWYMWKVHQQLCTHMHTRACSLNIELLISKNVKKIRMRSVLCISWGSCLMIQINDPMDHNG